VELRPLGSFVACQQTPHRLTAFVILTGVHMGRRIIRTEDGKPVRWIRKGVYQLDGGIVVTSADPAAP
jgi:hypothetical protein